MQDRSYVEENRVQRERLRRFVERSSDSQLAQPMPAGWTVAAVLAHMAFWDRRIVELIERWDEGRGEAPPSHDPDTVDWINDSGKPFFLRLVPGAAAEMAVEAAETADRLVADLSDELLAANETRGGPINPMRAEHRREHLDELEEGLSRR